MSSFIENLRRMSVDEQVKPCEHDMRCAITFSVCQEIQGITLSTAFDPFMIFLKSIFMVINLDFEQAL
jgi:hypothetical protein